MCFLPYLAIGCGGGGGAGVSQGIGTPPLPPNDEIAVTKLSLPLTTHDTISSIHSETQHNNTTLKTKHCTGVEYGARNDAENVSEI